MNTEPTLPLLNFYSVREEFIKKVLCKLLHKSISSGVVSALFVDSENKQEEISDILWRSSLWLPNSIYGQEHMDDSPIIVYNMENLDDEIRSSYKKIDYAFFYLIGNIQESKLFKRSFVIFDQNNSSQKESNRKVWKEAAKDFEKKFFVQEGKDFKFVEK